MGGFNQCLSLSRWNQACEPNWEHSWDKDGKSLHKGCRQMNAISFCDVWHSWFWLQVYSFPLWESLFYATQNLSWHFERDNGGFLVVSYQGFTSLFPVTSNWKICIYPWQRTQTEATTPAGADYSSVRTRWEPKPLTPETSGTGDLETFQGPVCLSSL